jgi:hypothetical protein
MKLLPFDSIEETKENAKLLCRALAFYGIYHKNQTLSDQSTQSTKKFSLQQTHQLIAKMFGCRGWVDLTRRIELSNAVAYIDDSQNPNPEHQALAEKIASLLENGTNVEAIYVALANIGFGCTSKGRTEAQFWSMMRCFETNEQMWKVWRMEAAHQYHARYDQRLSEKETKKQDARYKKALAEVMGTSMPKKLKLKKPN